MGLDRRLNKLYSNYLINTQREREREREGFITSKRNIKKISSKELWRRAQRIELQQRILRDVILLSDPPHGLTRRHHTAVVHHLLTADVVAATRQRNRQVLPHLDQVSIGDIVGGLDFFEGDEVGEHLRRDVVEAIAGNHGVHGAAVGYSGAVAADAGEGDLDALVGGDAVAPRGDDGEVVGAENGAEALDGEEGSEGGESGSVGGDVVDDGVAGGAGGAAAEGLRGGGVWRGNGDDEEE